MLSGLLTAAGFFTYHNEPRQAWLVMLAATLFSAYGQFYNQIDDYDVDKAAGLKNTVVLLGKRPTLALGYASLAGALGCMAAAIAQGLFPAWLGSVLIIGIIACALFPWELDMRGNPASARRRRPAAGAADCQSGRAGVAGFGYGESLSWDNSAPCVMINFADEQWLKPNGLDSRNPF